MAIIDKPSDYFNTKLYTGDNTNNRQISLDFSPDFTWIKGRNVGYSHILFDRVRTNANYLLTNATSAEADGSSLLGWTNTGCTTNSFTIDKGSNGSINNSGDTYVAWNWKAGGTAVSNTDGSITSSVSANQDAGFSIVSWTGTGANATIGHGLGAEPKMIFLKIRTGTNNWQVYNKSIGSGNALFLNTTDASSSNTGWQSTDATSSVFYVSGGTAVNGSGASLIAYCFADTSMSKMGSYTGNGSTDGTFVYLGFKPAFVMCKRTDDVRNWVIVDNKRPNYNPTNEWLYPNASDAGYSQTGIDLLSNGFKTLITSPTVNASGGTYIYMAFAENPFVSSTGVPATAR